jgi:hypothetical protein
MNRLLSQSKAIALFAVLALVLALSTGTASTAATPKVVGKVVVVGGTKNLKTSATGTATGKLHRVKANDELTLGQVLVMGRGATATLQVTRPKGVSADARLIDLKSVTGTPHKVSVSRKGAVTIIEIAPG